MAIDPFIAASLIGGGQAAAQMALQGGPKRQYKWNRRAAEDTNRMNRENQEWLLEQNRELQAEARAYDSPEAQMQRLRAAGLNPNLVYGNGSSVGNAFPIDAGSVPGVNIDAPRAALPDLPGTFIRSAQAVLGGNLTQARTGESLMRQQAQAVQIEIAKSNPMLRPEVASQVADMMERTAQQKAMESFYWTEMSDHNKARIWEKIDRDIAESLQRLGLNTKDLQIKNAILESKEFENVVKELNAKWLKDSEVTPEHIRQALMLLLSKMVR